MEFLAIQIKDKETGEWNNLLDTREPYDKREKIKKMREWEPENEYRLVKIAMTAKAIEVIEE